MLSNSGRHVVLAHLQIQGFRNLEPLSQDLATGSHLILGGNGAGKTSFLEAVYLLATTRSFRTNRIADCCRHGEDHFHLAGEVDSEKRIRLDIDWRDGRRERYVNSRRTSLVAYLSALPIVCWTSADSEILTGAPSVRRRFLDRGILGLKPSAIEDLSRYRRALSEKRQLLQRGGGELETWNQVLAAPAAEIVRLRSVYVEHLRLALVGVLQECGLDFAGVEIGYRCSLKAGLDGASAIAAELLAARERERALGQPILGPHRDDLTIRFRGHEIRRVASAGERKALGLALLAAHARVVSQSGRHPIYLLDDIDTELDRERLRALWRVVGSAHQLFVTSNRPQVWDGLDIDHRWRCSSGQLRAS